MSRNMTTTMMSRFNHLEFDDREPSPAQGTRIRFSDRPDQPAGRLTKSEATTGTPIRDAGWFRDAGHAAFRLGNQEEALRNYSRALEQDRAMLDGWLGQVRVLLETGEYKEADLWAGKALELYPEHADFLAVKAVASARMGKLTLALAQSDHAIESKGVTSFVWLARAEILLVRRKPMAMHCLDKAMELCATPESRGWTCWEIARLLRKNRRVGQANHYARQAMDLLPNESGIWLELARCEMDLKLPGARRSLEQAIDINPDCLAAQRLLRDYRRPGYFSRWVRLITFWK